MTAILNISFFKYIVMIDNITVEIVLGCVHEERGDGKSKLSRSGWPMGTNVVILMAFSSLDAPKVVGMTTLRAASDENVVNMTTFWFQCLQKMSS